jgi:hypothetical protein
MVDWFSTVHQNNQCALSSNKVDEELEERIDGESLHESARLISY